jgi:predicted CoA-substrate-specific enzyme activase
MGYNVSMESPPLFLGIDVGSTTTKAAAIDAAGELRARALAPSGTDFFQAARTVTDEALGSIERPNVVRTVATGYGRKNIPFAHASVTEITCHARGARARFDAPFTLIDIGGQDNKVIQVEPEGRVGDFSMNRKCAAGTGAFLEEIARRLDLDVSALEGLARGADAEASIGSFCTVFASTEILKLIRVGTPVADIAKGALRSVVKRILEMGDFKGRVLISGGVVAHNPLVAEMLAEETGSQVDVLPDPQLNGALGAALLARDHVLEGAHPPAPGDAGA